MASVRLTCMRSLYAASAIIRDENGGKEKNS